MGRANYDIPGLTSIQPLELFWQKPCVVDSEFFEVYKEALKAHTQINGSFYRNIDLTCTQVIEYLQLNQVKVENVYQAPTQVDVIEKPAVIEQAPLRAVN
ncbi:hypothetical protein [Catenovulum adriaticum]|uniref:Uncharacterized protein n=1 Tax=Catenovulum adriaticum TaxID=2984846 RepID=A0ABY7AM37_9ALTE|nr:hypothetical protein [Catenovulum sp. TS8]WAJ70554.1 hypothetical protein OLW01_01675 [Catenovulum sp. TS8]